MTAIPQLENNIAYCIDYLELDDNHIGEMLRTIEKLGIASVEYFCEEFIFICEDENGEEDTEALNRVHDDDYLKINWRLD